MLASRADAAREEVRAHALMAASKSGIGGASIVDLAGSYALIRSMNQDISRYFQFAQLILQLIFILCSEIWLFKLPDASVWILIMRASLGELRSWMF